MGAQKRPSYRIVISHSGRETNARRIERALRRIGAEPFLDLENVRGGDEMEENIFSAIGMCQELVVIATSKSVRRPWINYEIGAARARKRRVRIVGVLDGISASKLRSMPDLPPVWQRLKLVPIADLSDYYDDVRGRMKTFVRRRNMRETTSRSRR